MYQSLYRRFRPQRFDEVIGQDHLVAALRNAVRDDRVGHAYLFSGPRGTGKTSTARILAKALNCENIGADGEPCCSCQACRAIEVGNSMDLYELDAASNRGIDDVKELVRSVAMGTPGRRKVYILDEVHMLTKEASNALLKTLEEPPGHVVFVLATTDPQKVLATIRSRTQHVELSLIGSTNMSDHVREIAAKAGLNVGDEIVDHVVLRGGGSARDTLSALDQVVSAGGIADDHIPVDALVDSLGAADSGAALQAVAQAVSNGSDPRELVESLTRHLRDMFLVKQGAAPAELPASNVEHLVEQANRLGAGLIVRSLETLGTALVDARQAADPRLVVEVALVKLTAPRLGSSIDALTARVEQLEAALDSGVAPVASPPPVPPTRSTPDRAAPAAPPSAPEAAPRQAPAPVVSPPTPATKGSSRVDAARSALANAGSGAAPAREQVPPVDAAPAAQAPPPPQPGVAEPKPAAASSASSNAPSPTQIIDEWSDLISSASGKSRALFRTAEISSGEPGMVVCTFDNEFTRDRCVEHVSVIESLLTERFGFPMKVELNAAGRSPAAGSPDSPAAKSESESDAIDEIPDLSELTDAPPDGRTGADKLADAFPGARIVDVDET
ncbi:MAG: DNA polymerase III subunit gamma/tau [Actinomycetia bacterium]|nr:DNA polymerase III subunit gamma/tau [Actinomycetes bacterium]MCP4959577.1 DNA polymerase III subunit gamma/tau [Actinomycetes bacterium]